jgi:hypothetical protein
MLVHPKAVDNISEASVVTNKAYPLLRELVYHYGVQVIGYSHMPHTDNMDVARLIVAWKDVPVGGVYYDMNTKQFAFRSVMTPKERGRTHEDKYTYVATKVSVLMRSIKKYKLMPESVDDLINAQYRNDFYAIPHFVARSFTGKTKHNQLTSEETHTLLNIVFNNQGVESLSKQSIDKYKSLLDIFIDVDKVRAKQTDELMDIFSNPVWAIGYDKTNAFIVGKMRFDFELDSDHDLVNIRFKVDTPFVRAKDIDHIQELIPTLTMTKVHMQQHHQDKVTSFGFVGESQLVPKRLEMYIPELRVVGCRVDGWGTLSDMRWFFVL